MVTPDVHEIPGLSEAKLGWRSLRASASGRLDGGGNDGTIWIPRRAVVAACSYGCRAAPMAGCSCGITAFKELDDFLGAPACDGELVAEVALWGKVIEGLRGWRASRAYPVRVYVPYGMPELARQIRSAYGCQVGMRNFHQSEAT